MILERGIREVPISQKLRLTGVTKYKLGSRVLRAFIDLLAVRWKLKRALRYSSKELTPTNCP